MRNRVAIAVRRGAGRRLTPAAIARLAGRVRRAMRAAGLQGVELAISLTDDAELHQLNLEFAGEDHATDVLSFSQIEGGGNGPLLGDVVVSVATAARQAKATGRTLAAELLHLSVHGLVHLLGYDHANADEERVMFGYETKLRAQAIRSGKVARVRRPVAG